MDSVVTVLALIELAQIVLALMILNANVLLILQPENDFYETSTCPSSLVGISLVGYRHA